jgi:transposase
MPSRVLLGANFEQVRRIMTDFKLKTPCRDQFEMRTGTLNQLLPENHKARNVWEFIEKMDTGLCFEDINTFRGHSGRPASSPKILLALWVYSILDGNSSARKLEELCKNHKAYEWICGGVPVNRTMLAEFRSSNPSKFEDLLTNCLAVMVKSNLLNDEDFAQDGTKVKANAGGNSFRREDSLKKLKKSLQKRIQDLDEEMATNPNAYENRKNAEKMRHEVERKKRVDEALKNLHLTREAKIVSGKKCRHSPSRIDLKEVRASVTDPEARRMKMGDGGFRIAFNVQFATGVTSKVIYGVDVMNTLDPGTAPKMIKQVCERLELCGLAKPKNWIADAAYSGKNDINEVARLYPEINYYAPPSAKDKMASKKIQKNDSAAVIEWRNKIGTEEIENMYKNRASTAEFSNAQVKNRGLGKFSLRNLIRVKCEVLLHAISQNISRYFDLSKKKRTAMPA